MRAAAEAFAVLAICVECAAGAERRHGRAVHGLAYVLAYELVNRRMIERCQRLTAELGRILDMESAA